MIPDEFKKKDCALYRNFDLIAKKWTIFILLELFKNPNKKLQYNQILNILPSITPRALSLRLKLLEENKIVSKQTRFNKNQITTFYFLTNGGKKLIPIIIQLQKWGLEFGECKPKKQCNRCDFIDEKFKKLKN